MSHPLVVKSHDFSKQGIVATGRVFRGIRAVARFGRIMSRLFQTPGVGVGGVLPVAKPLESTAQFIVQ